MNRVYYRSGLTVKVEQDHLAKIASQLHQTADKLESAANLLPIAVADVDSVRSQFEVAVLDSSLELENAYTHLKTVCTNIRDSEQEPQVSVFIDMSPSVLFGGMKRKILNEVWAMSPEHNFFVFTDEVAPFRLGDEIPRRVIGQPADLKTVEAFLRSQETYPDRIIIITDDELLIPHNVKHRDRWTINTVDEYDR